MHNDLLDRLRSAFDSATRLYRLEGEGELSGLMAEAWSLKERLSTPWELHLSALSERADLDIDAMIGSKLALHTVLSDGSEYTRSGMVMGATACDADGGLTRYLLVIKPWLALLQHVTRSQVWQERSVIEIVESVFSRCDEFAAWSWASDIAAHLEASHNGGIRSYTVQYRESDFDFVSRLLAQEAIAYRFERDDAAPLGHKLVLFADSPDAASCPEDACSKNALGGQGIRFHGNSPLEEQDSIQAFGSRRQLLPAGVTRLAWDYKAKRAVAASVPTAAAYGGKNAPRIESYDHAGAYALADSGDAERAARLMQEAIEARHKVWLGRGTVRSFAPGTTFDLTQSTLDVLSTLDPEGGERNRKFLITEVIHAGINNLPKELNEAIAAANRERTVDLLQPWVNAEVRKQAARSGYGNGFEAIRAYVPWRPQLEDETGARLHPRPTAPGPQTATVVGPNGETRASGADEIHTDRLGRIRIQFHFQRLQQGPGTSNSSTWVRVLQRYAGAGMGLQFVPRIGQEVIVDFQDGNVERPVVIGALYNGRGEGGVPATPGGKAVDSDTGVFKQSSDHSPGGQGNLAGGNSPAWHGASADEAGQRNAAALSGFKTKEFGGEGNNRLVFDDTHQQLRVQLATTQHATQLNMGHLIHQADNHRGSLRGLGFELRTDAYGAVRAGRGLLISSFGANSSEPAGDNAAGTALALQAVKLAEVFSGAAKTHEAVQFAAHIGSFKPWQSSIDDKAAPLKALHTVLKGMVADSNPDAAGADAAAKNTAAANGKLPHTTDPVLAIAAKAGLGIVAGQDVQFAAGETASFTSGQDTQLAVGGAMRIHTGQAIGMLGGAIKPGAQAAGTGLTLIAAQGDVEMQAQAGPMQIAAKNDVTIQSAGAHIDWAAAKKIVLSTAGGASITIEGGNIVSECPGKITVRASVKSFTGPAMAAYGFPRLPKVELPPDGPYVGRYQLFKLDNRSFDGYAYEIGDAGRRVLASGTTDADGQCEWVPTAAATSIRACKSIMRESERITENWQGKLDQAVRQLGPRG